jgi:hypothetical protein
MKARKRALWAVLFVLGFAVMAGGCGGGGGGDGGGNGYLPGGDPQGEIGFDVLEGTWTVVSGSGRAEYDGYQGEAKLSSPSGSIKIENLISDAGSETATAYVAYKINWNISYKGYQETLPDVGDGEVTINRDGPYIFSFNLDGSDVEVTVNSNGGATVEQSDSQDGVTYEMTYTLK